MRLCHDTSNNFIIAFTVISSVLDILLIANHLFILIDLHNATTHLIQGTFFCGVGLKMLWFLKIFTVDEIWQNIPSNGNFPLKKVREY